MPKKYARNITYREKKTVYTIINCGEKRVFKPLDWEETVTYFLDHYNTQSFI